MSGDGPMSAWGEETKYFFDLRPEIILHCVEEAGIATTGRCLQRNSMENRVYEVELDLDEIPADRSQAFRIVKFYRPGRWSREQILEEHSFLLELHQNEIPCTIPLPFPDSETLHTASPSGIYFALFARVGGRQLDENSPEQLEQLGRLLARVHNVGEAGPARHRIILSEETYGISNLKYLIDHKFLPSNLSSRYQSLVESICSTYASLMSDFSKPGEFLPALAQIRLHGDCHPGNILWTTTGPFLIDFDDMVSGPPIQDLWLACPDLTAFDSLLVGYEQMRDFDRRSVRLIEPLRALRYVHFSAWIARRYEDPAFPASFPLFGTEGYWLEQINDLEDQVEKIQNGTEAF